MAHFLAPPKFKWILSDGTPAVGYKLYTYEAGTSTPLVTYNSLTESVPTQNTNPIVLDANGEAAVWISAAAYKLVLKTSVDVTVWTQDNVATVNNGSITTIKLADNSVTTNKIVDLNVTEPKMADNSVPTRAIQNESVTAAKLDPNIDLTALGNSVEVVFRNQGDMSKGQISGVLQYPWSAPTLVSGPTTLPTGNAFQVAWSPNGEFLMAAHTSTPYMTMWQRVNNVFTKLPDPTTLPFGNGKSVAWDPSGHFFLCADDGPTLNPYARSGKTLARLFTPTVFPIGTTLPSGVSNAISFSPNGQFFAVASENTSYVWIYELTNNPLAGTLTGSIDGTIADIAAAAGATAGGADPSAAQVDTAIATAVAPIVSGTNVQLKELQLYLNALINQNHPIQFVKLTNPANLPTGAAKSVAWSDDSRFLAVAHTTTPFVTIYERTGSTFTKLTNPTDLPAGNATKVAWSYGGNFLAVSHATSPFVTVYSRSGTTFTKIADPATLPTGAGASVAWSPNGRMLAVGHSTTPFMSIYTRAGSVLTKIADPSSLPPAAVNHLEWNHNGRFLAATFSNAPYISIYETAGTMPTNAILYMKELQNG